MSTRVCEPILNEGVFDVAFFNGRVLTAEDMQADQAARRQVDARLGRAIGSGVVSGLHVSIAPAERADAPPRDGSGSGEAALRITAGLALAPSGRTLELATTTDLTVIQPSVAAADSGFADCPNGTTTLTRTRLGFYLVTIGHATGFRERAPSVGFGTNGQIAGCGSRYEVQGVAFRVFQLSTAELGLFAEARGTLDTLIATVADNTSNDPLLAQTSCLRNRMAHTFFGTERLARIAVDPFALVTGQGPAPSDDFDALAGLRAIGRVTEDEVPLALLLWTRRGIAFVDVWSVRRRLTRRETAELFTLLVGDPRLAASEAAIHQFQEHLDWLRGAAADLAQIKARDHFLYLPPAGLLPIAEGERVGFDPAVFATGLPHRTTVFDDAHSTPGEFIDARRVPALLREALPYAPINVTEPELIWLYRPWQNAFALTTGSSVQPYLVFASGQIPPAAVARFDVARWDYANYGTNQEGV